MPETTIEVLNLKLDHITEMVTELKSGFKEHIGVCRQDMNDVFCRVGQAEKQIVAIQESRTKDKEHREVEDRLADRHVQHDQKKAIIFGGILSAIIAGLSALGGAALGIWWK